MGSSQQVNGQGWRLPSIQLPLLRAAAACPEFLAARAAPATVPPVSLQKSALPIG